VENQWNCQKALRNSVSGIAQTAIRLSYGPLPHGIFIKSLGSSELCKTAKIFENSRPAEQLLNFIKLNTHVAWRP
jgi:hypothetical protein